MMRQTPMMSNPFQYRETMWNLFDEGTPPPQKSGGQKALPRGGGGMTAADQRKLDDFNAEIERIKAKRAS